MTRRTPDGPIRARLPGVLVALLVLASVAATSVPVGAASTSAGGPAFVVAVDADGDADVTLRLPIDLRDGADSETLARVEQNGSAYAEQFRDRLARVAAETESETGRSMAVSAASVDVSTANSTAIVELSATWEGLAAVDGDHLAMAEPFASGFEPAQRFVVRPPEGYTVASATPAPDGGTDDAVAWSAGSDLDGFRAEFAPADGADGEATAAGPMPGFGLGIGLVALLAIGALGRRAVRR